MVVGQALRTVVVAGLLRPADFGILNLTNVLTNFTTYVDVGTGVVGQQHASGARGRGDQQAALEQLRAMAGARLVPALALAGLLTSGALLAWALGQSTAAVVLGFVALAGLLQSTWFSARGWLRVTGDFRHAMVAQLSQVLVWVTLVPLAAWRFGLVGALGAMALSYLPPVLVSAPRCDVKALVTPRVGAFRALLPAGVPVWLLLVTAFLLVNAEQLVVGATLGTTALGLYGIAMLAANAVVALSDGAAAAAHPQTIEAYERDGRIDEMTPSVTRVMRVVEAAFAVVVPLSWLGLAVVAHLYLTDYLAALPVVAIVCAGASAVGVATASNSALLAVGLHRRLPRMTLIAIVLKVALAWLVASQTGSTAAVAAACLVGSFFYAASHLRLVARALGAPSWTRFVIAHLRVPLLLALLALGSAAVEAWRGSSGFVVAALVSLVVASLAGGSALLPARR
ncbi:lipopolysaccharide biosynthesis protein [Janibacter anophelis]